MNRLKSGVKAWWDVRVAAGASLGAGSPTTLTNVLRTITEGLLYVELETLDATRAHPSVDAIAPPRMQLEAENANIGARVQRRAQGITMTRKRVHAQSAGLR